jgi:hypothetical protein
LKLTSGQLELIRSHEQKLFIWNFEAFKKSYNKYS